MSVNLRKSSVVQRLKHRLKAKAESLADQFEFRVYVTFVFKDASKAPVVYQMSEVIPLMTSNYELAVMKAAKEAKYTVANGKELLDGDYVQLHSRGYCYINGGNVAAETSMNFLLWPRSDIDHISCAILSRWKDQNTPFQHIHQDFKFHSADYQQQILQVCHTNQKEMTIGDSRQTMFMLVSRYQATGRTCEHCNLSGICLFLPQAKLTCWDLATEEEILESFRDKIIHSM